MMSLAPGEVHVWLAELDALDGNFILSDDELRRFLRILPDQKRARSMASRTVLRLILSYYTGQIPEALEFAYENGKPRLRAGGPRFSVSHSGGKAVYAMAADRDVGVDLEMVADADHRAIARNFFQSARQKELTGGEADERREFYRLWTRKEALAKAEGRGLAAILGSEDEPPGWDVLELDMGRFICAVAVRSGGLSPRIVEMSFLWRARGRGKI